MLSIGKLVTGAENYYLQAVAQGREDYYTGAGEAPGRWLGEGAAQLGLAGTVDPEQLRALLAGRHPVTGADLTAGRVDPTRRVAGFDCTLSAPKSVSVLWALGDTTELPVLATAASDPPVPTTATGLLAPAPAPAPVVAAATAPTASAGSAPAPAHAMPAGTAPAAIAVTAPAPAPTTVADAVRRAHDRAVHAAVTYLEAHALAARRGAGGEQRVATTGITAAAFRHRTSRAGDPQLHTHVLVANCCQGSDGRWSAPDARLLYLHARTAGFLYQVALRAELAGSLGLSFGPVRRGVAEVVGVPDELLRAFSTRRAEIEAAMERHGATSARAAEVAALDTRRAKSGPIGTDRSLHDRWRAQAAELGCDPGLATTLAAGPRELRSPLLGPDDQASLADALLAPTGLTAQVSVFERRDVVRAVAERLADGGSLAEVERLAEGVLADTRVAALAGDGPGGEGRRTTHELLATEARILDGAVARRHDGVAVARPDQLAAALDAPVLAAALDGAHPTHLLLAPDQRAMVEHLATSGQGVDVVVGRAGAGKTTALAAARRAWEAAGCTVSGAALSARAAAGLEEGAGIPSTTIAGLLRAPDPLPPGGRHVLVVDEAGMVGTRDLARLLARAGEADAKVVLVGDPRQLPEIDAGGAFGALARRLGAKELVANRRQAEPWERAGLDELRHGDVERALTAYERHGRVHEAPTAEAARRALVADWLAAREEGGQELRILAATRREVDELNAQARAALGERGQLGSVVAEAGGRAFALGDRVVCLRNDRRLGVVNGTRGTVVAEAATGGVTLLVDDDLRHLPPTYLAEGHLDHGYATTVHKSQGETVDRAFVLAGAGLSRESGYVALSRARTRTDLYVPTGAFEDGRGPDAPARDGLTRMLSTSRAKHLAREEAHDGAPDATPAAVRRLLERSPATTPTPTPPPHPGEQEATLTPSPPRPGEPAATPYPGPTPSPPSRSGEPEGWERVRRFSERDLGLGR